MAGRTGGTRDAPARTHGRGAGGPVGAAHAARIAAGPGAGVLVEALERAAAAVDAARTRAEVAGVASRTAAAAAHAVELRGGRPAVAGAEEREQKGEGPDRGRGAHGNTSKDAPTMPAAAAFPNSCRRLRRSRLGRATHRAAGRASARHAIVRWRRRNEARRATPRRRCQRPDPRREIFRASVIRAQQDHGVRAIRHAGFAPSGRCTRRAGFGTRKLTGRCEKVGQ